MGTVTMVEFLTVDGVMQGLGSAEEDTDGGFTRGGWGAEYAAGVGRLLPSDGFSATAAYLFGRRTFERMAAFWPHQPDDDPMAAHLNRTPKYVVFQSRMDAAWPGTRTLSGPVADSIPELTRAIAGEIVILGSGMLCRELLERDLVDRLRLFIHPLLLGDGKRLFGDLPLPRRLSLVSVDRSDLGTVGVVYEVRHLADT